MEIGLGGGSSRKGRFFQGVLGRAGRCLFVCCFNYNGGLFRRAYSLLRPTLLLSAPRLEEKAKQKKTMLL